MTPLQKLIYGYITINKPVCDHCITQHLNKNQSQNVNNNCRDLVFKSKIKRSSNKETCNRCTKKYILNYI